MRAASIARQDLRPLSGMVAPDGRKAPEMRREMSTRLFLNSRSIWVQFRCSCGFRHTRLRHFLLDTGMCRIAGFFLIFLTPHVLTIACKTGTMQSHFGQLRNRRADVHTNQQCCRPTFSAGSLGPLYLNSERSRWLIFHNEAIECETALAVKEACRERNWRRFAAKVFAENGQVRARKELRATGGACMVGPPALPGRKLFWRKGRL